ncbi:hypothetical protein GCM10008957_19170 [Deinococcus ruber]|uniref:Uncharacterized protein n=1 Tax=Deinococcus ruber TaxID=1848197 RepID=A0A918C4C3_9DEIO|nr:hypothetical protein GCM10008957_19170 [Deinococcus ruber]
MCPVAGHFHPNRHGWPGAANQYKRKAESSGDDILSAPETGTHTPAKYCLRLSSKEGRHTGRQQTFEISGDLQTATECAIADVVMVL